MFGLFDKLEDCDPLFKKFLSPWYPEKERPKMTRPDMYIIAGYEGKPLDLDSLQYLNDQTLIQTKAQIEKMIKAALADYAAFPHATIRGFKSFEQYGVSVSTFK